MARRLRDLQPEQRAKLSRLLRNRSKQAECIPAVPRNGAPLRLSHAQERIWFLDRLVPESAAYVIPAQYRLHGELNPDLLRRALDMLVARHEILRTSYQTLDGEPHQIIAPAASPSLTFVDLAHLPEGRRREEAHQLAEREARRPFDLARPEMLRATLIRLQAQEHVLLVCVHHIASDGWSMDLLYRELGTFYTALSERKSVELADLEIQYADYAAWQRSAEKSEAMDLLLAYWRGRLAGAPSIMDLPLDMQRQALQSSRGELVCFLVEATVTAAIRRFAREESATPFMVLLSAFAALLRRWSGETDLVIGSPAANRSRPELEHIIGLFVNTLPLRVDLFADPTPRELVRQVRETTLDAYSHQDLAFERLVEELNPTRDLSHNPIFQVSFALQTTTAAPGRLQRHEEASRELPRPLASGTAKFDLFLAMVEEGASLEGVFEFNTDLFRRPTIERTARRFVALLHSFCAQPDMPVSRLSWLPEEERTALLRGSAAVTSPPQSAPTFDQRFREQVRRSPDGPALLVDGTPVSYGELDARVQRLVGVLLAAGVRPGATVGSILRRGPDVPTALLAILRCGAVYLPLDPDYPASRLKSMCADAAATVVIAEGLAPEGIVSETVQRIDLGSLETERELPEDARPLERPGPAELAYVIYTSGSTGTPKGVELTHGGLSLLIEAQTRVLAPKAGDRVQLFASPSFDASIFEIALALASGATLCVELSERHLVGTTLLDVLRRREISHLVLPPSALAVLPSDPLLHLRVLLVAGEPCSRELVERWSAGRRMFNCYGPTEGTVWATFEVCSAGERPSIGRPIPGTRALILDEYFEPCPVGVAGELFLGGGQVGRGYRARPRETAERFVPDPFGDAGARMYRTGDVCRALEDGRIIFLRRADDQVKVRGFRIEPGEIEHVLDGLPGVSSSIVVAREDAGGKRVVAYVARIPEIAVDTERLRSELASILPAYMVPSEFVVLDEFPRTPAGKVDRRHLPAPVVSSCGVAPPHTALERAVAGLYEKLLGVSRVSRDDNFFHLGGHSLLAAQLVTRLRADLGLEVSLRRVFERPTLADFCNGLEAVSTATQQGSIPRVRR